MRMHREAQHWTGYRVELFNARYLLYRCDIPQKNVLAPALEFRGNRRGISRISRADMVIGQSAAVLKIKAAIISGYFGPHVAT